MPAKIAARTGICMCLMEKSDSISFLVFCQGRIPYPVPPTSFATLKNSQPQSYKYVKHAPRTPVGIPVRGVCVRESVYIWEKRRRKIKPPQYYIRIYGKTRSRRRVYTLSVYVGARARARVVNFGCKFKAHLNFYAVNGAFGGVNSQIVKAGRKRYPHGTSTQQKGISIQQSEFVFKTDRIFIELCGP